MLDKYFGFTKINNEVAVIDSLIEHSRIDEEELYLIEKLIESFLKKNSSEVDEIHLKISKIRSDSNRIFEYTEEQIIQANFDFQKQYDFLRIYQRIECISTDILKLSSNILVLNNIGGEMPEKLHVYSTDIARLIVTSHELFKQSLQKYENERSSIIKIIHKIVECDKAISEQHTRAIEQLYFLANDGKMKLGTFKAIENIFNTFETLGKKIEEASTSLEWLLIN
tara:strand:- start:19 stop:693 length:675 start_codon:yes stop_codon:yes gene_type:complete